MQEQKRPEAVEQESQMNQLQAQLTPLKGVDTELDDVLRVSAKLKMVDIKHKDDIREIKQDDRYKEGYKRNQIEDVRLANEEAVDALVGEFQRTVTAKSEELEARLKSMSAVNAEPPLDLIKECVTKTLTLDVSAEVGKVAVTPTLTANGEPLTAWPAMSIKCYYNGNLRMRKTSQKCGVWCIGVAGFLQSSLGS